MLLDELDALERKIAYLKPHHPRSTAAGHSAAAHALAAFAVFFLLSAIGLPSIVSVVFSLGAAFAFGNFEGKRSWAAYDKAKFDGTTEIQEKHWR